MTPEGRFEWVRRKAGIFPSTLWMAGPVRGTIAEFKAVSQNLMHSDLTITNGVYGVLGNDDM